MTKAAVSIFVFGWYILANAVVLLVAPNVMLATLGIEPTREPWLRLLGVVTLALSFYYILAAREGVVPFFRWTILGRLTVFVAVGALAVLGLVPAAILIFALIDGIGAGWTAVALRSEPIVPPVVS